MSKKDKLSVFISLVLRHKPDVIGITLDNKGWANVEELIKGVNHTGRLLSRKQLNAIVANDKKGRYSFNDDGTMIRANQGHSIKVDIEMKKAVPPEFLYHGTSTKSYDDIMCNGIHKMSRLYVHLSEDIETAKQVGKRHGELVVLAVGAKKMYEDGYDFFLSDNNVWQVDFVPCKYIRRLES